MDMSQVVEEQLSEEAETERVGHKQGHLFDVNKDGEYALVRVNTGSETYTIMGERSEQMEEYIDSALPEFNSADGIVADGGSSSMANNEYSLD